MQLGCVIKLILEILQNKRLKSASFAIIVLLTVVFAIPVVEAQSSIATPYNAPNQPPSPNPRPDWAHAPVKDVTYSLNWAGYVVTSSTSTITMVNGSWVVQTVASSKRQTYSAQWVGIGGFSDSTLIQTGTSSDSASGTTKYYAWYELLPASETQLGSAYLVNPGDDINAFVALVNTNSWNITINDLTRPWHYSIIVSYVSSQKSAEWIEERPAIAGSLTTLANFGTASYGGDYISQFPLSNTNCATVGTSTSPIGAFAYQSISMVSSNGRILAQPSSLTVDGTSFTVKYSGR